MTTLILLRTTQLLNDKGIDSSNNKINALSNDKKIEFSKKNVLDLFNKKRGGVK